MSDRAVHLNVIYAKSLPTSLLAITKRVIKMICTILLESKPSSSGLFLYQAIASYDGTSFTAEDNRENGARDTALKAMTRYIDNNIKPPLGECLYIQHI